VLRNLTIKTRLTCLLAFLVFQLAAGAFLGVYFLKGANATLESVYNNRLVALGALDRVNRLLVRNQSAVAQAITAPSSQMPDYLKDIQETGRKMEQYWGEYSRTNMDPEEARLAASFTELRKTFKETGMVPTVTRLKAGDLAGATTLLHESIIPQFEKMRQPANKLIQYQLDAAAEEQKTAQARYELVRNLCVGGVTLSALLTLAVGLWLIRSIVTPLSQAVHVAKRVAAGDLSTAIDTSANDEPGQMLKALRAMTDSLSDIVRGVRSGTDAMTTASSEIAAGNQDLSSRTEQQAASLEETASSMEELTATVKQTAENAHQGNTLAHTATETAKRGGAVMEGVMQTMAQINQSAHQIAEITSVIDGIAFQTNILALNAAVEAARAGEQGRGFAVVAAEVRNLAQRSATAAKEIKALIDSSTAQVEQGTSQVQQAGATMTDILQSITQVNDIMAEISSASHEQSHGIQQVNQAVAQMDQVTQQNAALVEEAAAAASSMQQEAERLAKAVAVFKLETSPTASLGGKSTAYVAGLAGIGSASTPAVPATPRAKPSPAAVTPAVPRAKRSARGAEPVLAGEWEAF
jgi:methyl-accepting chemotaxis protein-1 (serine sensor receptor)